MPKRITRLLHEQAMLAHEEELRRALLPIAAAFEEWKKGGLGSGELSDMIHEYHQGPARRLFRKYNKWAFGCRRRLCDRKRNTRRNLGS